MWENFQKMFMHTYWHDKHCNSQLLQLLQLLAAATAGMQEGKRPTINHKCNNQHSNYVWEREQTKEGEDEGKMK